MRTIPYVLVVAFLLASGCSRVTKTDLDALQSPNAILRKEAVVKIADRGLRVPLLDVVLDRDNEEKASRMIVEALRSGKESREMQLYMLAALPALDGHAEVATPIVLSKLKSDDLEIQDGAIRALAKMKHREAAAALVSLLEKKEKQYPVIWALGEIGDPGSIEVLNRLLASDDPYVRYNAHQALAKIGASPKANALSSDSKKKLWLTMGKIPFQKYQTAMANLLSRIGGSKRSQPGT